MALCPDCARFLFQLCAYAPAGACSCAVRNTAMPLPVADEGIAGLLQRSENRRNSVSPNDSPGTAKRIAEGEWSSRPFRGRVTVMLLSCYQGLYGELSQPADRADPARQRRCRSGNDGRRGGCLHRDGPGLVPAGNRAVCAHKP